MNDIDIKISELANVCYKFKSITVKERRTLDRWIECLEKCLRIINDILEFGNLNYSQMIKLERIINLLLDLPNDYGIDFNFNSYKQNKIINLLNDIEIQLTVLKNLKQEKLNKREKYKNFDEWINERNIIKLEDLNYDTRLQVFYKNFVYENEYSLYMDFRNVLLNRKSSNNSKLYVIKVMDDIKGSLSLDVDLGLVEVNSQVVELLSMANLVKNNLEINLSLFEDKTIEQLKGDLTKTINEKTLKMCL